MKLDPYLTPYSKINSKYIKGLNIRVETLKLLKENLGVTLPDLEVGNGFLHMTPKAQAMKYIYVHIYVHIYVYLYIDIYTHIRIYIGLHQN